MKRLFFCLIIALATLTAQAQLPLMQGRVVRVLDGDTFELLAKQRCNGGSTYSLPHRRN
jgi:endonuclease YncB( thermonuclease family)